MKYEIVDNKDLLNELFRGEDVYAIDPEGRKILYLPSESITTAISLANRPVDYLLVKSIYGNTES